MKYSKMDYARRISNSTPVQLVVINYELTLDYISDSKQNILDNNEDEFSKNITRAQNALQELMSSLDMSHDISWELLSIYLYVNKLLAQASAGRHVQPLDDAHRLLSKLLVSWVEIEKDEKDRTPLVSNTQQVYAGLTYGRNGLTETVMDSPNRGFKA